MGHARIPASTALGDSPYRVGSARCLRARSPRGPSLAPLRAPRYHGPMPKRGNGEGSKARKRKDGRYETRAVLETPTGRRRVSFYGATAKEANTKRTAALADQDRGVLFSDPKGIRVGEYLSIWLSDAARYQVSEGTYQRYERTCQNHLIPFFGRIKLRDLNAAHVRSFKVRKIEEGLNPNTVGVMQGVLSTALNEAVDDNLIPSDPTARPGEEGRHARAEPHARSLARGGIPPALGSRRDAGRSPHDPRAAHRLEAR